MAIVKTVKCPNGATVRIHDDYLPETPEEKVICYADKFYSKSNLQKVKTQEQAEKSLAKFGQEGLARFKTWEKLFEG